MGKFKNWLADQKERRDIRAMNVLTCERQIEWAEKVWKTTLGYMTLYGMKNEENIAAVKPPLPRG